MMTPIPLELPDSAQLLFNSLFASGEPALLEQGLVAILLGNGRHIDVSWHPEHDQSGRYYLTVYGQTWSDKLFSATFATVEEVAAATSQAARDFGGSQPAAIAAADLSVERRPSSNH
jgi:hypothetical protein